MSKSSQDPIKEHEMITVYVCDSCKTRYNEEEARKMDMKCCGEPLKAVEERVPMPYGP